MHLERLEISGFKSFSDRSELAFDRGVTAIVGPNGCGKSNVADALTWVLGEQSAKSLRGDKMEDVIFNGSDARKPTGAAEVRLRFGNVIVPPSVLKELGEEVPVAARPEDGAVNGNGHHPGESDELFQSVTREVEVTRRLFRSGESEYLIDGQTCRLKDIHELLMDTGLGAKAYAIIEQGKIGMILSSRPTDRRQLIEEAAGITKYKARRRAAELKLEAAQQNLTRLEDIIFEIDKQRGSLKRQAAKARRYTRLRDEMRRWEKVLFARRYRSLSEAIEAARTRLKEARESEAAASARLAEVENDLGRIRIELAAADSAATQAREAVHAHELEINRRQQQIALDTQQAEMLLKRAEELEAERQQLEARREPERMALEGRRQAAVEAASAREEAAALAAAAAEEYTRSWMAIEALEQDVEKARSDVYAILNTITALTAAHDSAAAQRERAVDAQSRLELEARELGAELERARAQCMSAAEALHRAQEGLDSARMAKAARESELSSARVEHEWRSREVRTREQNLAGMSARLRSLEEIDTHRSGFADAARMVLVNANGKVGQMGAVADFIEVEPRYERAVEACLGDLLQHILVERLEHVSAGLKLIRQEDAGRCGFIVGRPDGSVTVVSHPEPAALPAPPLQADVQETSSFFRSMFGGGSPAPAPVPVSVPVPVTMTSDSGTGTQEYSAPSGSVMLSSVVKIGGPFPQAITSVMGGALIADSFEAASRIAPTVDFPVVTLEGDVFRGRHVVTGGDKAESRGILATKREIKELREKIAESRSELERLIGETAGFEQAMAHATAAIAGLNDEIHRQEKSIVGVQAQAERATDDESRVQQRADLVQSEINRAKEEIAGLDARQDEARESINRLNKEKGESELTLAETQRRLGDARDTAEALSAKAAEARAQHAALVERSSAAVAEVARLEELAADLERRVESATRDMALMREQRERLLNAIVDGQRLMDEDVAKLEGLRQEMIVADELAVTIKLQSENQEAVIRDARRAVDALRALAAEVDVQRATAESDLTHLAQQAIDSVNASLDEIRDEVTAMEAAGQVQPDVRAIRAAEAVDPDEIEDGIAPEEGLELAQPVESIEPPAMTAEEAIAELREKIERMGPVNMMAIEQSKELEERHLFLTTQQKDLVDSIAQTNEAISKIDETTHARFKEAFTAINENFQGMFTTLFGGGKAGILLLDENDPLESGIDIVAQPPGKRLQSVMLLSGGEKALTAIALMFGMFKYRPSPFCLLDEIDAPLDDANIGRFVEMLRSMMDKTQFIVITHSRKTMEIADKLYGVTMEEPGVSKLISIQMN